MTGKSDTAVPESSPAQRLAVCLVYLTGMVAFWIPGLCVSFWWGRRYPFLNYQGRRAALFHTLWFLLLGAVATSYAVCSALIRHAGTWKNSATDANDLHWLYTCQNAIAVAQWLVPVAWLLCTLAMAGWVLTKADRRTP